MALDQIYSQTGENFIFIIDEWDCVFRIAQDDTGMQKRYLDFLRGLFNGAVYAELVHMTGILPIKKYGEALCGKYVRRIFDDRSEKSGILFRIYGIRG